MTDALHAHGTLLKIGDGGDPENFERLQVPRGMDLNLFLAQDREQERKETVFEGLDRFSDVFEKVLDFYVEELEPQKLIDAAIEGMLKELDPHSVYLDSYQYENLMIDTKGEFGGLGISITVRDDYPTVISPLEDTPAYALGIQAGDKIVKIEETM